MELPKTYIPSDFESDIYALWEKSGAFEPSEHGDPYCIVMPPPNANAGLHIGHSLMLAVEDVLARYHRSRGKSVLWLPGADHAGFETQVVYEKHLNKQDKSRFDFSRDELYEQIFEFVNGNKENFFSIFRTLGSSCDWSRFTFTLDSKIIDTSYSTFKKMWDDGLIYRGERLVNYCTFHRTGFADIEVDYETVKTPLYYIKYGPFTLATTRPETKFGDTGVAVHPDDERYKEWIGKTISVDGVNGRFEVRVVADEMVDPQFGTGVVKVTPAHSFDDWEVAQRHNLAPVRVINHDGTMNHHAGEFSGLTVVEARKAVASKMEEMGLIEKVDSDYETRIGKCYKCGTVIEPMLLDQWFIDMKKLAAPAVEKLEQGSIKFYPAQKRDQVVNYLKNVKDWNISRQIAWGIPIPAFQNVDDKDEWIFDERVNEEIIEVDGKNYRRDPDVFDTWFSSGQWPFATLGYPDSEDYSKFYPNAIMETGQDILYQWVARMICLGIYITGKIPFKDVYLHGMVRSEDGRKMSKSLGNVVDPKMYLDEYGSDALRMGMISGRSAGLSAAFSPAKIVAGRNFCNKLWNIARFVEQKVGESTPNLSVKPSTEADHWMLSKIQQSYEAVERLLEDYRFSEAYDNVYHLVWDDFADWYLESSKGQGSADFLAALLESILVLVHPFAPFVTETIWQNLSWQDGVLAAKQWPKLHKADKALAEQFEQSKQIISEIRTIVSTLQLKKVTLYHQDSRIVTESNDLLMKLAPIKEIIQVSDGAGLYLSNTKDKMWLGIDHNTATRYSQKLQEDIETAKTTIKNLEVRLSNEGYVARAPKELVRESKEQLEAAKNGLETLTNEFSRYSEL
ncbi:MAG: valine--tRNA ligase [bacterium]|nr:valine--tRNA ligase [bacterium]